MKKIRLFLAILLSGVMSSCWDEETNAVINGTDIDGFDQFTVTVGVLFGIGFIIWIIYKVIQAWKEK